MPSSETQGQIVGTRKSINGRKNIWHEEFSGTNQKPEWRRPFGTGLVRHCPQGLFSPFFTFLRAIYFSARLDSSSSPLSAPGSPRMRRCRQARNLTTNVPKILDFKSSSEQIFSRNCRWVPLLFTNSATSLMTPREKYFWQNAKPNCWVLIKRQSESSSLFG